MVQREPKPFTTTIDKTLAAEFRDKCKSNGHSMSHVLEAVMRGYVDDELTIEAKVVQTKK